MNKRSLVAIVGVCIAGASAAMTVGAAEPSQTSAQVIILKLDDVVGPPSPAWQRITEFLRTSRIKASYGIIGYSLEEDRPEYFDWIKDLHRSGQIEFWNHGYRNRQGSDKSGEFEGSYEEQKNSLERTQKLAREKLGIELKAFGPHWSGTNEGTVRALEEIPEITMWFYGPKESTSKFVFPRFLTLENPTHHPDFEKFKSAYEGVGTGEKCLALQGHPNSWNPERWDSFVKIIDFLKSKGCVFMTPSEYRATAR